MFESLEVWKRSRRLATDISIALAHSKSYALKDQIQRSAISIPSNIAEGSERDSDSDFIRFLRYSKGSCAELKTQLLIYDDVCQATGIESIPNIDSKIKEAGELTAMIQGFINKLSPDQV